MTHPTRPAAVGALFLTAIALLGGCASDAKPKPPRYAILPTKPVPEFLKGTVWEYVDVTNQEPFPVSSYGLVVGLSNTGDNDGVPPSVRSYMLDEMYRRGFGSKTSGDRFGSMKPERILDDKGTAIVAAYGMVPPGARAGQPIDLIVQAYPDSNTTSLAHGRLYHVDLRIGGANPFNPKGNVFVYARGSGPVFVNPVYAAGIATTRPTAGASLRSGTVLGGGYVMHDRPIMLRIRQPEYAMASAIQGRVNLAFPKREGDPIPKAQALDEAIVNLFTPLHFRGDWEHFVGVVTHLYLNGTREFSARQAAKLAEEALKPNAPLMDISLCWEGLGEQALPHIQPLYVHAIPDVAFAAARAGAFVGDRAAQEALLEMARADNHAFQLNAVRVLGAVPGSPRIDHMLGELLHSANARVRIEAYRILVSHEDRGHMVTDGIKGKFVVDYIPSDGPALVYAARINEPRIAIFGKNPRLRLPLVFSALNDRLTISSPPEGQPKLSVFYRPDRGGQPINTELAGLEVRELVLRLGGAAKDGFDLGYADVVGIVQALIDRRDVSASFVLQDLPKMQDMIDSAPVIPDRGPRGRPAGSGRAEAPAGSAVDNAAPPR